MVEWIYRSHKDELDIRPDQKACRLLPGNNNTKFTLIKDQSPVKLVPPALTMLIPAAHPLLEASLILCFEISNSCRVVLSLIVSPS